MIVSLIAFLKRIIGFVSLSSQRGKWILHKQTSCKLMVDRCAYVLLFYSVICYATLQTPYRCSSEAAETPLSRSIVSVIARLMKPFTLSPWASAWACIAFFLPFGTVKLILSSFSAIQLLRYSDLLVICFSVPGEQIFCSLPYYSYIIQYNQVLRNTHFAQILRNNFGSSAYWYIAQYNIYYNHRKGTRGGLKQATSG